MLLSIRYQTNETRKLFMEFHWDSSSFVTLVYVFLARICMQSSVKKQIVWMWGNTINYIMTLRKKNIVLDILAGNKLN